MVQSTRPSRQLPRPSTDQHVERPSWHRLLAPFLNPSFASLASILLILTALVALLFAAESVRFLQVSGENVYPESAGVLVASNWANGQPLYRDYRKPPYLMTAFPPLWYALMAVAERLTQADLDRLTLIGRVLSLACLSAIIVFAYRWSRKCGYSPKLAYLAPGFYLSFPILVPWAVTARPDLPGLLFAFLAVYWAARRTKLSIVISAIFAAISFLFRHNAVAAPVSVVLWLCWSRKWTQAALFCGAWALVVASVFLPFDIQSHGMLSLNLSSAKFGSMAPTYLRDVLLRILESPGHGFAIALAAFGTLGFVYAIQRPDPRLRLSSVYLVSAFGFAALGSAAAGGTENHFLEAALALALLVPPGVEQLQGAWNSKSPVSLLVVVLVLVVLLPSLDIQRWNAMHAAPEDLRQVVSVVRNRRVFTDVPYLAARNTDPGLVDLASLINTEKTRGWASWSSDRTVEDLQQGRYELVVLSTKAEEALVPSGRYPRWPRLDPDLKAAISAHYVLCYTLQNVYVYVPGNTRADEGNAACPAIP
jgi:hypothetical protein